MYFKQRNSFLKKNNNIYNIYNMPYKINMFLSNRNNIHYNNQQINVTNLANLATVTTIASRNAPSNLNAPIISRVHNVTPGCGSCGRSH